MNGSIRNSQQIRGNRNKQIINILINSMKAKRKRAKKKEQPVEEQVPVDEQAQQPQPSGAPVPFMLTPQPVINISPGNLPSFQDIQNANRAHAQSQMQTNVENDVRDLNDRIAEHMANGDEQRAAALSTVRDQLQSIYNMVTRQNNNPMGLSPIPEGLVSYEPEDYEGQDLSAASSAIMGTPESRMAPEEKTPGIPDEAEGRQFWSRLTPEERRDFGVEEFEDLEGNNPLAQRKLDYEGEPSFATPDISPRKLAVKGTIDSLVSNDDRKAYRKQQHQELFQLNPNYNYETYRSLKDDTTKSMARLDLKDFITGYINSQLGGDPQALENANKEINRAFGYRKQFKSQLKFVKRILDITD